MHMYMNQFFEYFLIQRVQGLYSIFNTSVFLLEVHTWFFANEEVASCGCLWFM